ncbi:MAG: hypothetical protein AAF614_34815 [Chloroflexota bacterium]
MMKIGIIGDYDERKRSHVATNRALRHATAVLDIPAQIDWLPTPALAEDVFLLHNYDALWCSPGSPYDSMDGALNAIRYARENDKVFFGT